jgi:hypothetical protein
MTWNDVFVKMGWLTSKLRNKDVAFTSLKDANNHLAQCCGVHCCQGESALRLPDQTTDAIGEIFWDNNVLRVRRPNGTIGTITIT